MRRKCCKGGLDGCSNTAWLTVAISGRTNLSVAMTECPSAVTHFSESVELELIRNRYVREAELSRDIRQWLKSEDDPGISARNRIQIRLPLRRRLLRNLNLGQFPPPGMFVAGWPNQLLEAIISNIDAKTFLNDLCKKHSYNSRAFSRLVGETFFSELTLYDRRGQGTVTCDEFQSFIGTASEKLHMRLDKDRYFLNFIFT
ncbi:hypothetical protein DPMN_050705 [Dreissena polymorpha]|uniref:EF-hand domain-containing protein n=1 Tax=Dreissena polymorpha TaxID=45954 RepID=A0A9D4CGM5_DREPO|nr:hypothetical protein DPMN_050705 [Dreissena polymorpha]